MFKRERGASPYCPRCIAEGKGGRSPSSRATAGATHQARRRRVVKTGPPWSCWICGGQVLSAADLHLDHVVPLSRGGADVDRNVRTAHSGCNLKRGAGVAAGDEA